MINHVMTSGEVAKVMGINMRTVIRLIDSGKLKGFKIPGSKHRRVEEKHLRELMQELGISEDRFEILDKEL